MVARENESRPPLTLADIRLVDSRLVLIEAKRLRDPSDEDEDDGPGTTRASMDGNCPLPSKPDDAGSNFTLSLTISLDGFPGSSRDEADRSFAIRVGAEFLFKAERPGYFDEAGVTTVLRIFVAQAFPTLMLRARNIAHEMGFTGVDPDIGVPTSTDDIEVTIAHSAQLSAPDES